MKLKLMDRVFQKNR